MFAFPRVLCGVPLPLRSKDSGEGQQAAVKAEEPSEFPSVLIHQGIVYKPQPGNFRVLVSMAGCVSCLAYN